MVKGFFSKKENFLISKKERSQEELFQRILNKNKKNITLSIENLGCEQCGLWKEVKSPKMEVTGKGLKKALILAECPGKTEDEKGIQLVGEAGQVLREALKELHLDLDRDFWKMNVVNCRTSESGGSRNRTPTDLEIKCCRHRWVEVVEKLKPEFIFLLGEKAVKSFFMFRGKKVRQDLSISRFRKLCIPDSWSKAGVISLYHPSYVNRKPAVEPIFKRDLRWAVTHLGLKKEVKEPTEFGNQVKSSTILEEILQQIERARCSEYVSIDYETTGLRPYSENQEIVSIGFSLSGEEAFSFPFNYPGIWIQEELTKIKNCWSKFLKSPAKKIVHSCQMESSWSRHVFGAWENFHWDTMVTAHVLDEREKFTSLDFQVFLHWGFEYGEEIGPYKKEVLNTGFNRMKEVPLNDLLKYNGLDALFTRKLFMVQQENLVRQKSLLPAVDLFNRGIDCLSEVELMGVSINLDYCKQENLELASKISCLEKELNEGEEAINFNKKYQKTINFGSNSKDLPSLFFDLLKYSKVKMTVKGNDSVDESVLQKLDTKLTRDILQLRKLNKIKNTYLSAFLRSTINGKIHPSFNLHIARSYRSCIAKGSLVEVVRDVSKFPKGIPIEKIKVNDLVYCYDEKCALTLRKVIWAGKTGHKKVVRIHWRARGKRGYLDVTPDHKIRLADGRYIKAGDLKEDFRLPGTSLKAPKIRVLALGRTKDLIYFTGTKEGMVESRFLYKQIHGDLTENEIVHHKDGNHLNHNLDNLEKKTRNLHCKYHGDLISLEEKQKRGRKAMKKMVEQGKRYCAYGEDNPSFLGLSKWEVLRLLSESKGMISKIKHDFKTFKKYIEKYKIDLRVVRLHYDNKAKKFITQGILKRLKEKGISEIKKELGMNCYKIIRLFEIHGIVKGEKRFRVNNHTITKIEELDHEVDVYNLEVEEHHNFIVNEICVKNSSSDPINFQNIPKRDEDSQKTVRSAIVPSPGNILGEVDYGGHEVRVVASLSEDKNLIRDLLSGFDIHSLFAGIMKVSRFDSKNQFVFAEIYGSYYASIFKNLVPLYRELKESTVKEAEEEFWKRYSGVRKWQMKLVSQYKSTGYVNMPWGFRRRGFLERNKIFNSPVQGAAFFCLLWSLIRINEIRKKEKWKTSIIGQIHDSILFDMVPEEKEHIITTCKKIMVNEIMEENTWIKVPFIVDWKFSPVDGSWYDLKEDD